MAVEYISTIVITASPQTVTVPTDATLAVLFGSEYSSNATPTLNSVSLILAEDANYGGGEYTMSIFYLANPATGSISLVWQTDSFNYGNYLAFFKGVDTASPILSAIGANGPATSPISGLTATANDMMVGLNFNNYGSGPSVSTDSQTQIGYTESRAAAGYKLGSTTFSWVYSNGNPCVSVAATIKALEASATGLPRRALSGPFYGSLRGSV